MEKTKKERKNEKDRTWKDEGIRKDKKNTETKVDKERLKERTR